MRGKSGKVVYVSKWLSGHEGLSRANCKRRTHSGKRIVDGTTALYVLHRMLGIATLKVSHTISSVKVKVVRRKKNTEERVQTMGIHAGNSTYEI